MGIYYDAVFLYGIEIEYNEAKELIKYPEIKEIADYIGTDNLSNVLSEFGEIKNNIKFFTASPWFDAQQENLSYFIGVDLDTTLEKIQQLDSKNIDKDLKEICEKYNLKYKTPCICSASNVW